MTTDKKPEKIINRLDSRNIVRPLVNKLYGEGLKAAAEGRPVAWSMVNWWEGDVVMRAMGVTPVYPENYGTVCASAGIAQKYMALSDAEGFPSHLCGYSRNCLGYAAEMTRLGQNPTGRTHGGNAQAGLFAGKRVALRYPIQMVSIFKALFSYSHVDH